MKKVILLIDITGNHNMEKLYLSSKTSTIVTEIINSLEPSDNYHLI